MVGERRKQATARLLRLLLVLLIFLKQISYDPLLETQKKILTPTGDERRNKRKPPKIREELPEEANEKPRKILKKKTTGVPEVNLIEDNNNKPAETVASKVEEEVAVVKSEAASVKGSETAASAQQENIPLKKSQSVVSASQEVINTKTEEEKENPANNSHAEKLIEEVNNDESLMASLKHLMERADLNEIIMSLDFVRNHY